MNGIKNIAGMFMANTGFISSNKAKLVIAIFVLASSLLDFGMSCYNHGFSIESICSLISVETIFCFIVFYSYFFTNPNEKTKENINEQDLS